VTRDPAFDSAWLKWGRAVAHAQALQADLQTFAPDGGSHPQLAVRAEYKPKRHGFAIYVAAIEPLPRRLGLILGDIANNFRSALDQLAWALVSRGATFARLTERQKKAVYFPICDERKTFNDSLPVKLPGVGRTDIARVRRYQPYHRRRGQGRWSALLLLAELNAIDKHRAVQPVWGLPVECEFEITDASDCVLPFTDGHGITAPLEIDAEIGFIRARKGGDDPQIRVKAHLAAEPSFKGRVLLRGWLQESMLTISELLLEFSEPPGELFALGVDFTGWAAAEGRAAHDAPPP
jgi:hypothetical protein